MLELNGLYKVFNAGTVNEKRAIDGLDLTLEEGDFVTVIGGNGAGKSTTLNLIAGVFPADRGTIRLNGVDITRLPEHKRAKYLGRVFQDPMMGTAATMGIEENLALANRRGKSRWTPPRYYQPGAGALPGAVGRPGPGPGKPLDQQSGASLWWTAASSDSSDGNLESAEAPSVG